MCALRAPLRGNPEQLAARSHTFNTRIIRRARALTDFQAQNKKRQLTVYKDCKTYFFILQFVTSSTKGTRVFTQSWAQLFEGRLALNPGLNLTQVSFSCVQKHFLG